MSEKIKFTKAEKKLMKKAIKVFDKRGWCRGELEGPDGEVCAVGALNVASGLDPSGWSDTVKSLEQKIDQVIKDSTRTPHRYLIDLNDSSKDGKRPIVRLFERLSR